MEFKGVKALMAYWNGILALLGLTDLAGEIFSENGLMFDKVVSV